MSRTIFGAGVLTAAIPQLAVAHEGHDHPSFAWTWDPLGIFILALLALLYGRGIYLLWRRAGVGRGIKIWQAGAFVAAWTAIAGAMISPLDAASEVLFSAHMSQHELLMLVGAPLIVIGRGLLGILWGLPERARLAVLRLIQRPGFSRGWRALTAPLVVLLLHAAALWVWHIPVFFEAALENEYVHSLQHFLFFATAGLFFWSLVHGRHGRSGYGLAVLFVFLTALHTTILGALVTIARGLWYPTHAARTAASGRAPIEDQQLAGLIMWIPAGVLLVLIGLGLFAAWLGESERRVQLGRAETR